MKIGELNREGNLICSYLEGGGGVPSPVGKIGIGRGSTDRTGYLDLMAEIGGAIEAASKEEERLTKKKPTINLLVKRWANYLLMVRHRNCLRTARKAASLALSLLDKGGSVEELQKQEELVLLHSEALKKHKKENDRLRRNKIYLKLMDVFANELRRTGIIG